MFYAIVIIVYEPIFLGVYERIEFARMACQLDLHKRRPTLELVWQNKATHEVAPVPDPEDDTFYEVAPFRLNTAQWRVGREQLVE